jgi:metallophosphoesterase (TIGR00282 family)
LQNKVKFLYIGDIMGEPGLALLEHELSGIKQANNIDFVIAQAENVSDGRGCRPEEFNRLKKAGVDFCTGGNWSLWQKTIWPQLSDPNQPIIRPANYPEGTAGLGWKYSNTSFGKVLVISLLGKIVGRDSKVKLDNPLKTIDAILDAQKDVFKIAVIVNFHGDYSSEKVIIGQYLNGRVSAVIGDHWHVPTADGRVLANGTAHITDVGMVGALNSSLGIKSSLIIDRWRNDTVNVNELEPDRPWQLNGFIFDVDIRSSKALSAKSLNLIFD